MVSDGVRRVVVWGTGGIGSISVRSVHARPDLELRRRVGAQPRQGRPDAGELAGVGEIGVVATGDVDALLALEPDCVIYAASGMNSADANGGRR